MSRSKTIITRRRFLIRRLMEQAGANIADATRAIDTMAAEHPEIHMEDRNTWKGFINEEMSRG